MSRYFILGVVLVMAGLTTQAVAGSSRVRGYYRKNGTYVQPHYRSQPDNNPYNNWTTKGNVNPYTGARGERNPNSLYGNEGRGRARSRRTGGYGGFYPTNRR